MVAMCKRMQSFNNDFGRCENWHVKRDLTISKTSGGTNIGGSSVTFLRLCWSPNLSILSFLYAQSDCFWYIVDDKLKLELEKAWYDFFIPNTIATNTESVLNYS